MAPTVRTTSRIGDPQQYAKERQFEQNRLSHKLNQPEAPYKPAERYCVRLLGNVGIVGLAIMRGASRTP